MPGARQLKLSFVLPSLHGGGAERVAVSVMNALDPLSFDRELYLFRREGPYLNEVSRAVRIVAGTGTTRVGHYRALRRHLRDAAPDVVVSFLSYFTVFAAVQRAGRGARFVINQGTPVTAFLDDADYRWRRPVWRQTFAAAARRVYPAADAIVATSEGVQADLVEMFGVSPDRVTVVHNPVDLDLVAARAEEPVDGTEFDQRPRPAIVAAGRLAEAKNHPLLVGAIAALRNEGLDVDAYILGTGPQAGLVRAAVGAAHLEDRVHLLGFQENPWKYFKRAAVFVLTSRYEGFGNVLIEAMACGAPVVATASPGTREIIRSGHNGLLVEEHEPAAVAAAIRRVLTDRALAERLRACAIESVRAYDVNAVARQYASLFQSLAARSPGYVHA
jgi:glycosyltransferase involved in cell wall biosynthesis